MHAFAHRYQTSRVENEPEVDNLVGRSVSSSNVPLHLSVQQKEKETECRKTQQREKDIERERERK
jgi:hypothetical protein